MGMYTEICCKIRFDENLDDTIVNTLKYMVGGSGEEPDNLPNHDLFKTDRWHSMLRSSSYYHIPKSNMDFFYDDISKSWYLIGRSDLKNYHDEIELFFDWVKYYCEYSDEFIGYSLYEESNEPSIFKS